jgi:hypothetical protein
MLSHRLAKNVRRPFSLSLCGAMPGQDSEAGRSAGFFHRRRVLAENKFSLGVILPPNRRCAFRRHSALGPRFGLFSTAELSVKLCEAGL